MEAGFVVPVRATTFGLEHHQCEGGHIQLENSSTSDQTAAALQIRTANSLGKRKAGKVDFTNPKMVLFPNISGSCQKAGFHKLQGGTFSKHFMVR